MNQCKDKITVCWGVGWIFPQVQCFKFTREDQGVRAVIPHIGPIPIIIPLKLFLDRPRDPVFPRGLSDSQSYAMNFTHVES